MNDKDDFRFGYERVVVGFQGGPGKGLDIRFGLGLRHGLDELELAFEPGLGPAPPLVLEPLAAPTLEPVLELAPEPVGSGSSHKVKFAGQPPTGM